MFKINNIQDLAQQTNYIELLSSDNKSYAKVSLNLGGSLQELTISNENIITNLPDLAYEVTYASAILFPFANRIKNGNYTFQQKQYVLELNSKEDKNAIHGLVYNKIFKLIEQETTDRHASVTIGYSEVEEVKGFPFKYSIFLTYKLTIATLKLKVEVRNDDQRPLPFNVGWHPYFISSNLHNSFLTIQSNKKLVFDKHMIPTKIEDVSINGSIQIKDKRFDDCFILNTNNIGFKTPNYYINLSSSSKENYLQVYTLNEKHSIAIEPITGPASSFNHKRGLQILDPDEIYEVNWKIKLEENE